MNFEVQGGPAFSHLHLTLDPGESLIAEPDAMSTMQTGIQITTRFNGGCLGGLARQFLGGESLFINTFTNKSAAPQRMTITQGTPGDIRIVELDGTRSINLQPGAFIASTPGVKLKLQFAGWVSAIAREGLFRLNYSGQGTLIYGAYGGLIEKEVDGEYIVDTSHLVAYEPHLKLKLQWAGSFLGSIFGGEGLVTRIQGKGRIIVQSRSMSGLVRWLNPKL